MTAWDETSADYDESPGARNQLNRKQLSGIVANVIVQQLTDQEQARVRAPLSPPADTGTANDLRMGAAYERFCGLMKLAENELASGKLAEGVSLLQIAARYAYPGSAGLFGSDRLEKLLVEAGRQIRSVASLDSKRDAKSPRRILHILSYGRPVGGDTRFVWRWMQEDSANQHSVVMTSQADVECRYEVPEILKKSAEVSGGAVYTLGSSTSTPIEQARELRALCQNKDVIVLHIFPYDIVPILALASGCDGSKTLYINHSDHTFWIGASVAHLLVHLRTQPEGFLRERRGVLDSISPILPVPLFHSPPSLTREEAKRALGYAADTVVLLTIASPFKYSSPGLVGLLELVLPVLRESPEAVLIAVGPAPRGAWEEASANTNGRIVPLGTRWDNELLYAAADIYLDSVPFSSITSLVEAGSHGTPLLGYRISKGELALLGPGAPGIDNAMILANDGEGYRTQLTNLITDGEYRAQCGRRVKEQILSLHTGPNWREMLADVYAMADQRTDRGCRIERNDLFQVTVLNVALSLLYPPAKVSRLMAKCFGALSYRSRVLLTTRLCFIGIGPCYINFVPPPFDAVVWRCGRWTKRMLRRLVDSFPRIEPKPRRA